MESDMPNNHMSDLAYGFRNFFSERLLCMRSIIIIHFFPLRNGYSHQFREFPFQWYQDLGAVSIFPISKCAPKLTF